MMRWRILHGDVRDYLRQLQPESVQCAVTSPPYWGLRDYGITEQLGLEPTPDAYVAAMVEVFRDVRRVLRDDGTLWLNLGDSYVSSPRGNAPGDFSTSSLTNPQRQDRMARPHGATAQRADRASATLQLSNAGRFDGLKAKDLCGIPWRVAFALQADGWYLRSDIIWSKPNPMPESVTDRPTKAHEYIFLLTKSARYYYDADAIAETVARTWEASNGGNLSPKGIHKANGTMRERGGEYPVCDGTRNKGNNILDGGCSTRLPSRVCLKPLRFVGTWGHGLTRYGVGPSMRSGDSQRLPDLASGYGANFIRNHSRLWPLCSVPRQTRR